MKMVGYEEREWLKVQVSHLSATLTFRWVDNKKCQPEMDVRSVTKHKVQVQRRGLYNALVYTLTYTRWKYY